MKSRIPHSAIIGMGILTAGAAALSSPRERLGYLVFGAVLVGGGLVWNRYIEDRLIAQVIEDGLNYPAPPSEVEQRAR